MDPLLKAAIEATKAGDKTRAQAYLKQLLTANPNNVDGWLVMATLLDNPERKRQCFNRVLQLDPTNQIARNELLKLDRAAMSDSPAPVAPADRAPAVQPEQRRTSQQSTWPQREVAATFTQPVYQQPIPAKRPASPVPVAKPGRTQVFTYPLWMRISTYVFAGLFWLLTCLVLVTAPAAIIVTGFMAIIALPAIWVVSAKVEVSDQGIRSSRLLTGASQLAWSEIARFDTNAASQNMTLTGKSGKSVKIASQVGGYGQIIELLRRKRPDLFGGQPANADGFSSTAYRTAFLGKKEFKRSMASVIFGYVFGVICLGGGVWGLVANLQANWLGAVIFLFFGLGLIGINLFGLQGVTVEAGQLTISGAFNDEQLTPRQIKQITLKTMRGRRGRVTHFVVIQRAEGGNISLSGLEGGAELLYGTLMNWWQSGN